MNLISNPPEREVIVVSGIPRSGTSMMMAMLAAAGIEILADDERPADEDNPGGYHEFEPVKKSRQDASWLDQAGGKAVKVIHLLLTELPTDRPYKIIMMHRDLDEVIASQDKMLARRGRSASQSDAGVLKQEFQQQLADIDRFLAQHPSFARIDVDYNSLLADPKPSIQNLIEFLQLPAAAASSMQSVIDDSLYRNRRSQVP